jgi:hypothetical protein
LISQSLTIYSILVSAFNPQRAKTQNTTVGVSFGATRELAFIRAAPQENGEKVRLYFPQTNNGVFSFGRDANILWSMYYVCVIARCTWQNQGLSLTNPYMLRFT